MAREFIGPSAMRRRHTARVDRTQPSSAQEGGAPVKTLFGVLLDCRLAKVRFGRQTDRTEQMCSWEGSFYLSRAYGDIRHGKLRFREMRSDDCGTLALDARVGLRVQCQGDAIKEQNDKFII